MNCKPGDLAVVMRGKHAGKLVEVLYLAPPHNFKLPDGAWNQGEPDGQCWVIHLLGAPIWVRIPDHPSGGRFAAYGSARDNRLRPLKGEPLTATEPHGEELTV